MVVKINNKSIQVKEDGDKSWWEEVNWYYVITSTSGYLLALYVMDFVASVFLGVHPFPAIKFIGSVLSWFS